jgi:hypothetical protein
MGWLIDAIQQLKQGQPATVRPRGGSMRGRIEDNQEITIVPVRPEAVQLNDVVLVSWKGTYILHLVKEATETQLLIGNNIGKTNGWVNRADVIGLVKV